MLVASHITSRLWISRINRTTMARITSKHNTIFTLYVNVSFLAIITVLLYISSVLDFFLENHLNSFFVLCLFLSVIMVHSIRLSSFSFFTLYFYLFIFYFLFHYIQYILHVFIFYKFIIHNFVCISFLSNKSFELRLNLF